MKVRMMRIAKTVLLTFLASVVAYAGIVEAKNPLQQLAPNELPAFPGAEGFGSTTVGGRGGRVIKVTNLNPSGAGSLQEAAAAEGPRIVVFEVSGVIHGDIQIRHPYITIAGQTAPGAGITIEGMVHSYGLDVHDVIIRFMRIRPRRITGATGDAIQMGGSYNVILDHVSMSWAVDEVVDIITSHDWTLQWCTIEESDTEGHDKGRHNYGLLSAYSGAGNISVHHNLFAHHMSRNPSITPYEAGQPGDFRNNVVYDFETGFTHSGHVPVAPINFIANYYKRGPSAERIFPFAFIAEGEYYVAQNFIEGVGLIGDPRDTDFTVPSWVRYNNYGTKLTSPASIWPITTHSAEEAYQLVLAQAGSFPRDRVTIRTIEEVKSGTGQWGRNAPLEPSDTWFLEGLQPGQPPLDSDGDGMPDAWEDAHGLDKNNGNDHSQLMSSGYSAIEEYLNHLAEKLITESNPSNADLNQDGLIDAIDIQLAINAFMGMAIDPQIIARADIDGDGTITATDIQVVGKSLLEFPAIGLNGFKP